MTTEQCKTCARQTKHCQDAQYSYLEVAECWNYEPKDKQQGEVWEVRRACF